MNDVKRVKYVIRIGDTDIGGPFPFTFEVLATTPGMYLDDRRQLARMLRTIASMYDEGMDVITVPTNG